MFLSQRCSKLGSIKRKSITMTIMTTPDLFEISTAQILKVDSRITSPRARDQVALKRKAGEPVNGGELQGLKAPFICTEAVGRIEQ